MEALDLLHVAGRLAHEFGDEAQAVAIDMLRVTPLAHLERYDEARAIADRCLDAFERAGDSAERLEAERLVVVPQARDRGRGDRPGGPHRGLLEPSRQEGDPRRVRARRGPLRAFGVRRDRPLERHVRGRTGALVCRIPELDRR